MAQKDSKILFVSNMTNEVASESLAEAFWAGAQVEVVSVEVLMRGVPGGQKKPCGLATVKFNSEDDLSKALDKMDGYLIYGRPLILRRDKFVSDDPNYKPHHQDESAAAAAVKS